MKAKDIVLVALLAAILKSAQVILNFLPNVEIVSVLILIFAIRLGAKKTVYFNVGVKYFYVRIFLCMEWICYSLQHIQKVFMQRY